MSEQPPQAKDSEILQILTTEHNNLQAIRSATIFESNGRTNLYLGTVSSGVVALAFIGQASEMSQGFYTFAFILIPSLIFIGIVTFLRVYETGIEDMIASRGVNRIRHYYLEAAPHMKKYFIMSANDDMKGILDNIGAYQSRWQLLVSAAGLVSVINSILIGVFIALLIFTLFQAATLVCVAAGVVVFVASVALHVMYQDRRWKTVHDTLAIHFPSDENSGEKR